MKHFTITTLFILVPTSAIGAEPVQPQPTTEPVTVVAPVVQRPQRKEEQARYLYDQGKTYFETADYISAISVFTKALQYTNVPMVQGRLLLNIGLARQEQFKIDRHILHLKRAELIYERYLDLYRQGHNYRVQDVADARTALNEVKKMLRIHEQIQSNLKNPAVTITPPPPPSTKDTSFGSKKLGIGLAAGGGVFLATGVGLLVYGSGYKRVAKRKVEDLTKGDPDHPVAIQGDKYIEDATRQGHKVMWIGGATMAVGVAGVVVGALQIKKSIKVAPSASPSFTGILVTGRF